MENFRDPDLGSLQQDAYEQGFSAGCLHGLSEAEECIPEPLLEAGFNPEGLHGKLMYNKCRQKTLDNLAKLKEGK